MYGSSTFTNFKIHIIYKVMKAIGFMVRPFKLRFAASDGFW